MRQWIILIMLLTPVYILYCYNTTNKNVGTFKNFYLENVNMVITVHNRYVSIINTHLAGLQHQAWPPSFLLLFIELPLLLLAEIAFVIFFAIPNGIIIIALSVFSKMELPSITMIV